MRKPKSIGTFLVEEREPEISSGGIDTWYEVRKARQDIRKNTDPEYRRLERSWQLLEKMGLVASDARDYEEYSGQPPLAYAMFCIRLGFYPPPEVMIGLSEQWGGYIYESFCDKRLETAFLGPPARKGGDFRTRWQAAHSREFVRGEVRRVRELRRCSFEFAAQLCLDYYKWRMTVETILKYTHAKSSIKSKRKNKRP